MYSGSKFGKLGQGNFYTGFDMCMWANLISKHHNKIKLYAAFPTGPEDDDSPTGDPSRCPTFLLHAGWLRQSWFYWTRPIM